MLGVSHEELVSLAEKHFAGLSSRDEYVDITPCRYTGSEVCLSVVYVLVRVNNGRESIQLPLLHQK